MRLALVSLLVLITALLVVRAVRRDRRDYAKFKKLKTTEKRQKTLGKWLRESFFLFGGLSILVLLASWQYVPRVLLDARSRQPINEIVAWVSGDAGVGIAVGASIAFVGGLVVPVLLLRRQGDTIATVGDVAALLPRTRGEVKYGAGLAINAGLVEELLFRLGMPALIFGIVPNGLVAFGLAVVIFGALHIYQGVVGVVGTLALGILLTLIYIVTGSIFVVIIVHALIDLRSLVLIPLVVRRVWGIRQ